MTTLREAVELEFAADLNGRHFTADEWAVFQRFRQVLLSGEEFRRRGLSRYIVRGGLQVLRAAWDQGWRDGRPFPPMHVPSSTDSRGRGEYKLVWWGLAERADERDEEGHGTTLRITPRGVQFYRGELTVPRYAIFRVRTVLGHEDFRGPEEFVRLEGPAWGVMDARVDTFDRRALFV